MYKTKDLTREDLSRIHIKNQAEIVRYIGSELNPIEAFELIKKESKGFTKASAKAEEADKLLYAIYKGEAIPEASPTSPEVEFEWKPISKEEATQLFKKEDTVYAIGDNDQKILVQSEGILSLANKFAIQVIVTKQAVPKALTNEQIRILKVKKETELAVLALKIKQRKQGKQKRKSA